MSDIKKHPKSFDEFTSKYMQDVHDMITEGEGPFVAAEHEVGTPRAIWDYLFVVFRVADSFRSEGFSVSIKIEYDDLFVIMQKGNLSGSITDSYKDIARRNNAGLNPTVFRMRKIGAAIDSRVTT